MLKYIPKNVVLPDFLLYALVVTIPFVTFSLGNFLGSWISPYYIIALGLVAFALWRNVHSINRLFWTKSLFLIFFQFIIILISDINSVLIGLIDAKVQFKYIVYYVIFMSITFGICLNIDLKEEKLLKMSKYFIYSCLFIFVFGFYQFISLNYVTLPLSNVFYNNGILGDMWPNATQGYSSRIWSTFPEPSVFSNFLTFAIPFFIGLKFSSLSNALPKPLVFCAIIFGLLNFSMSRSSGTIIAIVIGTLIYAGIVFKPHEVLLNLIKKPQMIIVGILILAIVGGLIALSAERAVSSLKVMQGGDIKQEKSYATRFIGQKIAIDIFKEYPILGIGYGNYSNQYVSFIKNQNFLTKEIKDMIKKGQRLNPYGNFTRALSETGIIGFISFIALIVCLARDCLFIIRSKSKTYAPLGYALLYSFVCINVHGFIDTVYLLPQWWLMCALIVVTKMLTKKELLLTQTASY